jgi:hypothetical protein
MSYSDAVKTTEEMKEFLDFQAFKKMKAGLNPNAVSYPPIDERMRTESQKLVREKKTYQDIINSKKEHFKPFDAETFVPKMFHKTHLVKDVENNVGRGLMTILRTQVQDDPSRLNVIGGIHNNEDGTKTYLTACIKINEYTFYNIHFYGALRGNFFALKKIGICLYEDEIICECIPPPPPPSKE